MNTHRTVTAVIELRLDTGAPEGALIDAAGGARPFHGWLELAGAMSHVHERSDYQLPIPEGDWTTLGGYTFARIGRIPTVGDRAPFPGGELEVVAMDGRRVAALRVHRTPAT